MSQKDKIIIALDVSSEYEAVELVQELKDYVGAFKIGLELFTSIGPKIIESVKEAGADKIFFDGKFHDIPNTVAGAAKAAVRMGVWMFNIHTSGGSAMMRAASEAAVEESDRLGVSPPLIIGVTVLTSISSEILHDELNVDSNIAEYVSRLSKLAEASGLDGVVASPHEIKCIKNACGEKFLTVTPGVRPAWSAKNDQKRIMTPSEAIQNGSGYLVIGRAITSADDRIAAAKMVIDEIETVTDN